MKSFHFSTLALAFCSAISLHTAGAVSLPVFGDASSTSKNEITTATGKAKNLVVTSDQQAFVIFDLAQLPPNYTADNITSARLRIYVSKITKPGDLSFHTVTSAWSDTAASAEPSFDPVQLGTVPQSGIRDKGFILVDITALVLSWIDNPGTNFGIAIAAPDADQGAQFKLGSREGPALGFPAELEVEIGEGSANLNSGTFSFIGGGNSNTIEEGSSFAAIVGGESNVNGGSTSVIGGGTGNIVGTGASSAVVGGGIGNVISGTSNAIGGGAGNVINPGATFSTIPGGDRNRIGANVLGGFAAGRRAQANHSGSFVFSDSTDAGFLSTAENQISMRFANGLFFANDAGPGKVVPVGTRYRDNAVIAWARVTSGGAVDASFNVTSVTRVSTGRYSITLASSAGSGFSLVPVVTPEVDPDGANNPPVGAANARFAVVNLFAQGNTLEVYMYNGSFALVDNDFHFLATGR